MKHYITFLTIALAATVACSKQEVLSESPVDASGVELVPMTFTASCEEIVPRASLSADTNPQVVWAEGDQLAVYDGSAIRTFTIKAGEGGKTTAEFEGSAADVATYTAVFPYAAAYVEAGVLKYTVPAAQNVGTQSVDPAALVATATSTDKASFNFTSAVGLLRFDVPDGATKAIFHTKGKTETLAGESHAVVVTLPGTAGTFEAAVEPGTYEGIRAFVRTASGDFLKAGASNLVVTAGHLKPMGNIKTDSEVVVIEDADELIAYLGGSLSLDAYVCADLDLTSKVLTSRASFANVFDGQHHSISKLTTNASAPMFAANTGTVKDFTLENDCVFTLPATLAAGTYAFVVGTNNGNISGITNKADVADWNGEITGAINVAIIVGAGPATSVISDCRNEGDLTIISPEHAGTGTAIIGGVCGKLTNKTTSVTDCVNTGDVTFDSGMNASGANLYLAGVIGNSSSGVVTTRCSNEGNITVNITCSSSAMIIAGVNSYTSGAIEDCSNHGNISVSSDTYVSGTAIGGIAAYTSAAMRGTAKDNLINTGNVTLTAQYQYVRNNIGSIDGTKTTTSGVLGMGGIVGYTYSSSFSMDKARNEGEVSFSFSKQEGQLSPASKARITIGGLVGDGSGNISNSDNFGNVSASTRATGGTFTATTAGCTVYIGGISGSNYISTTQSELNITNCVNEGNVSLHSDNTQTTNHAIGGIVGWPGIESACTSITSGCVNGSSTDPSKGQVSVSGNITCRIGGIQGGSGRIENCTNYGKIWAKSGKFVVGGLAGFHSGGYQLTGSKNYGTVQADVAATGIGGLIGNIGNAAHTTGTGCEVHCTLTSAASTEIGMVVGHFNGKTQSITLGTDGDPIEVSGTVNGTVLTAGNYENYIYGPANYEGSYHTFHTAYGE